MFLETVVSGEQDLVVCARKAYGDTLKRYHGWIVQGIFSVSRINFSNESMTLSLSPPSYPSPSLP